MEIYTFNSILMVAVLLFFVLKTLSKNAVNSIFKDYPFECGVSSNMSARKPFSMPFFFISMIFLMFDVEMIFVSPVVFISFNKFFVLKFSIMVVLLVLSLLMEWFFGSLNWSL